MKCEVRAAAYGGVRGAWAAVYGGVRGEGCMGCSVWWSAG